MALTVAHSMKITEREITYICTELRKNMENLGSPEHEIRRAIANIKQDFRAHVKGVK